MKKIWACLFLVIVLSIPLMAEGPAASTMDKKVGGALLERITKGFLDIAVHPAGSKEDGVKQIDDFLVQAMISARRAKDENLIDPVFYARYQRLLAIIKLMMAPDKSGILTPLIDEQVKRFIYEVLGEEYKGSGPGAIKQVANAIADEIINLQLYMDNVQTKAKLRQAFDAKFSDTMPKKK